MAKKYKLKKGVKKKNGRNIIPLRAKFEALQLAEGDMILKEVLAVIVEKYDLDGNKPSYTKHAGSTINRFREEIGKKLKAKDKEAVALAEEFEVEYDGKVGSTEELEEEAAE